MLNEIPLSASEKNGIFRVWMEKIRQDHVVVLL